MKRELISLSKLEKVMRPKEMKNVLGGSGGDITKICDADTSSGCDNETECTKKDGTPGTCKYEKNSYGIWQCRCS